MVAAMDDPCLASHLAAIAELRRRAVAARQRRAVLICGEADWCRRRAAEALAALVIPEAGWIGAGAPAGARCIAAPRSLLGQELPALVFDAHSGFDPDAFGAASGAVVAGGVLLLLTPPLAAWPAFADPERARIAVAPWGEEAVTGRFLNRLARLLAAQRDLLRLEPGRTPVLPETLPPQPEAPVPAPYASDDQQRAVTALCRVMSGHRRRPLVLLADRGRGKSAAFGLAAARLMSERPCRLLITGPRREAAEPAFDMLRRRLPQAERQGGELRLGEARIGFVAPDELARVGAPADLLLVDEAAALPTPLLSRLLRRYARIAFASTVHGYEGSGRGFALRFRRILDRQTPGWRELRLEQPVRWAAGDPLEALTARLLLLDAEPADDRRAAAADAVAIERLDRDQLAGDEASLASLFGLLVLAHYRTRPFDLRHLLDGPNLEIFVARHGGDIVGALVLAVEGGLDPGWAEAIAAGRRRLRGHLIPQSLAAHLGLSAGPVLRCGRVMRIVVHPACQGRGIGRRLLAEVEAGSRAAGLDLLGSSFGASPELLAFWAGGGLEPVRVGVTREAMSGEHSVMVLKALSAAGRALFGEARERYGRQLPQLLAEPLRALEPELAGELLRRAPLPPGPAPGLERLAAFARGERGYEDSLADLWEAVRWAVSGDARGVPKGAADLLVAKVLQRRGWAEIAADFGYGGREECLQALRAACRALLAAGGD